MDSSCLFMTRLHHNSWLISGFIILCLVSLLFECLSWFFFSFNIDVVIMFNLFPFLADYVGVKFFLPMQKNFVAVPDKQII